MYKRNVNKILTIIHLVLISLFTILSIVFFNVKKLQSEADKFVAYSKVFSCWVFVSGVNDLMITYMIWRALDDSKYKDAIKIGNKIHIIQNSIPINEE